MNNSLLKEFDPLVFALLPLLKVWNVCLSNYLLEQYLVLVLLISAVTVVLILLFYLRLKNFERSALIVSLIVSTFYFWIGFRAVGRAIPGSAALDELLVVAIYLLLCANAIWVINRWAPIGKLSLLLNLFSIVVLLGELVPIFTNKIAIQKKNQEIIATIPVDQHLKLHAPDPAPDIYFFLVDAYANPHTLKELYNYDSKLVEHLKSRGFFIADQAEAVHDRTSSSVPSTLNMRKLVDVTGNVLSLLENWVCPFKMQ